MENAVQHTGNRLHFKNPPIIEAVIAFSVTPLPDSALERFLSCSEEMRRAGYRLPEPVTHHQFEFTLGDGTSSFEKKESPFGLKFVSEDGLHAVQFNRTVFVFSRLGKYDCWESFRDEGKRLWEVYAQAAGQPEATMAGVRYINKLFIPTNADPADFVSVSPRLPPSIAPMISELFMRVGVPIPEPSGKFIHTQALLAPEREGFATLLLDNDFQFPVQGKTHAQVWEMLEAVRDLKDHYFLEMTTDKMREAFDA